LAVGAVSFGSILARLAGESPLVIAFWRVALASLLLWPYVLVRDNGVLRLLSMRDLILSALSGFALSLHFTLWISSLFLTSVANSTILVSTNALFVALAERLTTRRIFPRAFYLALALAFLGMFFIVGADFRLHVGPALWGDLLALGGGAMAALYFLVGSSLRDRLPIFLYAGLSYSFSAIFLALALVIGGQSFLPIHANSWIYLVPLALGPQLLGHTVLNFLLAAVRPAYLTLAILGEPIGATLWAYLIFGEVPGLWVLLGGALILVALAIAPRQGMQKLIAQMS
jgi:drug/metabolite transporter (DMT)-like permease